MALVDYEKLKKYKYKAEITIIDAGKEEVLDDNNVRDLLIEYDYNNNFFPILRLNLNLSNELFYRIQEFRKKVKFKVALKKYEIENEDDFEQDVYGDKKMTFARVWVNVFQPFMMDINPFKQQDTIEGEGEEKKDDVKQTSEGAFKPMEIYLFCLDHLNRNKKIVNAVIDKNSVKNTIGFLLNECGIDNVLMNKPENDKVYDQILLPPFNFKNSIGNLSSTYGIFKSGIRQFMDFDMYYLLSNNLEQVPVRPGEYDTVFINIGKVSNPATHLEGSYKDFENKCYVVNLPNNINYATQDTISKETDGSNFKVFSMDNIKESTKFDAKTGKFTFGKGYKESKPAVEGYEGEDKVSYVYNHTGNEFLESDLARKKEEEALSLSIPFNNIDMEMLTINKRFVVRLEDPQVASVYNGVYRLNSMMWGFDSKQQYAICEFKLNKKA